VEDSIHVGKASDLKSILLNGQVSPARAGPGQGADAPDQVWPGRGALAVHRRSTVLRRRHRL